MSPKLHSKLDPSWVIPDPCTPDQSLVGVETPEMPHPRSSPANVAVYLDFPPEVERGELQPDVPIFKGTLLPDGRFVHGMG